MSLNHSITYVFWAPSSLLGHCHCSHCQHRVVVRDGGGRDDLLLCPGNLIVPAVWQKEQGKAEKLIVG